MKTFFLLSLATAVTGFSAKPQFAPTPTGGMASLSIKDDPMAPLGKQWTSSMDRKVSSHDSDATDSPINFYGEENQANGKGGKGPLSKEWTSSMDMRVSKSSGETAETHFQPYGLDHQANGHGGRSPLGKEWTTSMDSKPRKQGF